MSRRLKVINRLPQELTAIEHRAAGAVLEAVILGGSEAAAFTPQDTGVLMNSQYRAVEKQGTRIVGRVGYTAEYALAVHEAEGKLKGQPRPKRDGKDRGVFWGPHDGEPGFLAKGFERARPEIEKRLRAALKRRP